MRLFKKKKKEKENKYVPTGNYLFDYYNNYDEDSRLLRQWNRPEFLTTMRYIEKYITPDSKVIEIGAGTGRYSVTLAEKGYFVTAVELVPHNIEVMKKKVKPGHKIEIHEGNACDLSKFESDSYDIVLMLGPMYHLYTDEDKHKALSEAIRIAKPGGVIFAAYLLSDAPIFKYFRDHEVLGFIEMGLFDDNYNCASRPEEIFELYRKSDIDELMKNYNVERLHFVGTDMLSELFKKEIDEMGKREFEEYIKFLSTICESEECVGMSFHVLDIFRKEKRQ